MARKFSFTRIGGLRMRYLTVFAIAVLVAVAVFGEGLELFERWERGKERAALAQQAKITIDQARDIALKAVPGAVEAVGLDRGAGRIMYVVMIRPQLGGGLIEVQIDATNGKVLKTEPGDARD